MAMVFLTYIRLFSIIYVKDKILNFYFNLLTASVKMTTNKLFKLFCLVFLLIFSASYVGADVGRPGKKDVPTEVYIAVYIIDLDNVSSADQNFTANVFVKTQWNDPRLKHNKSGLISMGLKDIWHPRLQFLNQQRLWFTIGKTVSVSQDGEVTFRERAWGDFSQPLSLHDFPFDSQYFNVQIVPMGYSHNEVKLIQNTKTKSGMAQTFSVADWEILNFEAKAFEYNPFNEEEYMNGFQVSIHAKRESNYFITTIIIPLVMIVMMSWAVFWIDPKQSGTQMSVAMTTMLTLIAFRFAVAASLPNISYLTRMDIVILSSTILVFASLLEVVITSVLSLSNKLELARRVDKVSRWVFPIVFIITFVKGLFL